MKLPRDFNFARGASSGRSARWVATVCLLVMVGGCAGAPPGTKPTATGAGARMAGPSEPVSNTDACATHMHDVLGGFLLYYAENGRLPDSLDQLRILPGMGALPPMVCPVSNRPYLYTPNGILMPEQGARIILADPAPSHSRMRWAVRVEEPAPNEPLLMRVVALPESFFLLRPPE
jgi:hypothetical protein